MDSGPLPPGVMLTQHRATLGTVRGLLVVFTVPTRSNNSSPSPSRPVPVSTRQATRRASDQDGEGHYGTQWDRVGFR